MTLQRLLSYTRKAVDDYGMIEHNDKIAVGISGGKDSMSLLTALKGLQRFYPKKFEIFAVAVDLGLGADYSEISKYCENLGTPLSIIQTDIAQIVFDERKEKNPCSLCAKMRKGALNTAAEELGCNKIALGHNKDDIIETFIMSLFFEGRIYTFAPITYLDRMKLFSIRPLMYAPEHEIKSFAQKNNIPILINPCPADGETKREEIKSLLRELGKKYTGLEQKIFGAVSRSNIKGWEHKNPPRR
ncbi:MAG: tRNA 2-thiocytidine(32) synthetase TtcA [Firmicutes bacterium]|nr:tRNA 2-thiocytidine(32) synthetase TtcA [Bacillota bacterium]